MHALAFLGGGQASDFRYGEAAFLQHMEEVARKVGIALVNFVNQEDSRKVTGRAGGQERSPKWPEGELVTEVELRVCHPLRAQ